MHFFTPAPTRRASHYPPHAVRLALITALALAPLLAARPASAGTRKTTAAKAPAAAVDPLAQRLCSALHTVPEARRAECCSTSPGATLSGECARTVSAALHGRALRLDPAGISRCEADSVARLSGCDWVTTLVPRRADSCAGALVGLAPAGAACSSALECQDGLACQAAGPKGGVCAPPAAPGSFCGGTADPLSTYLRDSNLAARHPDCAGYCLAGRCAAFSPLGAACASSRQCASGQHCGDGVCKDGAMAAVGEACTGTSCGDGASCQQGRCAPLKSAGDSCSSPFECRGACLIAPGAQRGTCGMKCGNGPLPPTQGEITGAISSPSGAVSSQ